MNRLIATVSGVEIGSCMIHTGTHISARRVPAIFACMALKVGASITVETARGPKPRRIVNAGGRFYTRVEGAA